MTTDRIRLAGWASIASVIIGIPATLASWMLSDDGGILAYGLRPFISLVTLSLFLFAVLTLRKILLIRFGLTEIKVWMDAYIVLTLMSFLFILFPLSDGIFMVVTLAFAVLTGIAMVIFGIKLLAINREWPEVGVYAYARVAEGILSISIILMPIALIPIVIADVALGLGLLRMAAALEQEADAGTAALSS